MEKRNDSTPDCGYTLFGALCQKIPAAPYSAEGSQHAQASRG